MSGAGSTPARRPSAPRWRERADPGAARLRARLSVWRCYASGPLQLAARLSDQRDMIDADVRRWCDVLQVPSGPRALAQLLYAFPEFRAVFYHRLARGNPTGALLGAVGRRVWKPVRGLDLLTERIGPGLFVSHGHGTVLSAEVIGDDLWVHQGVTIGWDYRGDRLPRIGSRVFVGAGAKILGAVTIGDGARIGANAVVLCDVPAGATAVGVPARVLPAAAAAPAAAGHGATTIHPAAAAPGG